MPSAARSVATCRRGPRSRSTITRSPTTRPSGPVSRHWNESSALACVFVTASAGLIVPSRTTCTPAPRSAGEAAQRTASRRLAGPSSFGSDGGAHRAGHDHRLGPVEDEVPQERGLLDHVGALDDDDAVDRRVRLAAANLAPDLEQLREREVARGRAPEVDDLELGDLLDARRASENRRAVEGRDLPAGDRVDDHADRPAREQHRDPAHRRRLSRSRFGRSASPCVVVAVGVRGGSRPVRAGRVELRAGGDLARDDVRPSSGRIGPRLMIEKMPDAKTSPATTRITTVVPTPGCPRSGRR